MSDADACFFRGVEDACIQPRPERCPVHGPILRRLRLKLHYLASRRKGWPRWKPGHPDRMVLTTVCGIELYDRYTLAQVSTQRGGSGRRTEAQLLEEDWVHAAPPLSLVPGVEFYYQIAWYKRELAVVATGATCKPCARKGPV